MPKFEKPYSAEMEAAVCGSVMIEGEIAINKIRHLISADDFYYPEYKHMYRAFEELHKEHEKIDVLTVSDWLKSAGYLDLVGGPAALTMVSNEVPTSIHVASYAKAVSKYSTMRKIMAAAKHINEITQAEGADLDTVLQKAEETIKGVTRDAASKESKLEIADLSEWMRIARKNKPAAGVVRGLSTGLAKIDKMTEGFMPGELMIVSGQTSHGKTQLSNNIMLNVIRSGKKVMFITMEMTKEEIGDRFNSLTDDEDIAEGQILLNMHADLAYQDVTRLIERAKEKGCDMVVIDHLHYFSRSVENATAEVSKIVKEFKSAAVVYEMPIILICHVRKMAAKQHPTIEHLRDSSLIAQDADIVLMVWRDDTPSSRDPNSVEITLWKNRNRQKKHRRAYLFADGIKLNEDEPEGTGPRGNEQSAIDLAKRIAGEKDDDDDLELPW